jgi:hypothetical protein
LDVQLSLPPLLPNEESLVRKCDGKSQFIYQGYLKTGLTVRGKHFEWLSIMDMPPFLKIVESPDHSNFFSFSEELKNL